jgi:tetratricopeptide (TPR) repeat protein
MSGERSDELKNLIERYEKAPESRIFAPLADAYRKVGDLDKAIEVCEKGLEQFPDYASARVILGKCFYDKGATERARGEFERVLGIDPDNMVALKFMGEICLAEDEKEKASEYYRKLLSIDPMNEEAEKVLGELESAFEVKEIDLGDKHQVKDERPGELATMTLAGIYTAQGYYNKALKIYQDILSKEPENVEVKGMVEKLQSLLDSSEAERDSAFGSLESDISIEQIDEGSAADSSGMPDGEEQDSSGERGFILVDKQEPSKKAEEPEESLSEMEKAEEEEEAAAPDEAKEEEKPEKAEAEDKKEEKKEKKKEEGDEIPPDDKDNFQAWLRKLKGD